MTNLQQWQDEFDALVWPEFIRNVPLQDMVEELYERMALTDGGAGEEVLLAFDQYADLTRRLLANHRGKRTLKLPG